LGVLAGSLLKPALEIVGGDWLDGVMEGEFDDNWGCGVGGQCCRQ
jgi:hypothetical protein